MRTNVLMLLATPLVALAQPVFKCPGAGGSVVIQQMPCTGGQPLEVRSSTPEPSAQDRERAQRTADAERRALDVAAGMSAGYPVVGMTLEQLAHAVGPPARISVTDDGNGLREQRVYHRGGRTYHVHTERGRVTKVQSRAAPAVRSTARDCPSELEIRNLQTEASSITLSDAQRKALLRRVADAQACR